MEAACKNLSLVSLLHNITTVKVSKNIKKLIKLRKLKKSNHEIFFIKLIKILEKSTGSVRFHKLETKKPNQTELKSKKTGKKIEPKPSKTSLNRFLS